MGHLKLDDPPLTPKWLQVVKLLYEGADTEEVAAATLDASKTGLKEADKDRALVHSFWLLTQIPLSARCDDFAEELRKLGLPISDYPTLMEVIGAFADAVDDHIRDSGGRTDLGEMAQLAATESLTALASERTASLFGTTPEDVQRALREFSTSARFRLLARDFFARLTERYLTYFLSRELSNHVGGDRRFSNTDEHTDFNNALHTHCRRVSRIVEEFAGGWFSKTNYEGGITPQKAAGFVHVALKKITAELARGEKVREE